MNGFRAPEHVSCQIEQISNHPLALLTLHTWISAQGGGASLERCAQRPLTKRPMGCRPHSCKTQHVTHFSAALQDQLLQGVGWAGLYGGMLSELWVISHCPATVIITEDSMVRSRWDIFCWGSALQMITLLCPNFPDNLRRQNSSFLGI